MLAIRILENEIIPIIAVEGKIDAANKREIDEAIDSVLSPTSTQLILDLTGVTSMDAGEVQAIIEATHRSLGAGGRLALVVTEKEVLNALKESRVFGDPGVLIFRNRKDAEVYLGERRLDST